MEFVLAILVGAVVSWVGLMIVVPIAGKWVGFGIPSLGQFAWKLAVIVLAASLVYTLLAPVQWFVSLAASFLVIWLLMWRWFDADLMGVVLTLVLWWILRMWVGTAILAALAG